MPNFSIDTGEVAAAASGIGSVASQMGQLEWATRSVAMACLAMSGGNFSLHQPDVEGCVRSSIRDAQASITSLQSALGMAVTNYQQADTQSAGG